MSPRNYAPTPQPLTPGQRVAALRHLAAGRDLDTVATILHTSREHLVAGLHTAADDLTGRNDRAAAPRAHPEARAIAADAAGQQRHGPVTPPTPERPADRLKAARTLAAEASLDPSYRIRQAGNRLAEALVRLESTRKREAKAARERRDRAAAREKAQASSRLTKHPGAFPCRVDDCDDTRDTAQGRTLHELRAHGGVHTDQEAADATR